MSIIMVNVNDLKPHPRQHEFFDNMAGLEWSQFVESIKESKGPIVPITITEDNIIVSGHQRVNACRHVGIRKIKAEVIEYNGDEMRIVKDLIEINVRQRGKIESSPAQVTARVEALKAFYGVRGGRPSAENSGHVARVSESEIYKKAGTNKTEYKRAKVVLNVIPEWQEALEADRVANKAVREIVAPLSEDEQRRLFDTVPRDGKILYKDLEAYANKLTKDEKPESQATEETASEVKPESQTETAFMTTENPESPSRHDEREDELLDVDDLGVEILNRINGVERYFERLSIYERKRLERLSNKEKQQLRIQFDNLTQLFKMTIMGEEIVD